MSSTRRRYNIVHIVEDLKIGGIERIIATIASNSDKRKYYTDIICLTKGGETAEELKKRGFHVILLGMGYHLTIPFLLRLCKLLKKIDADIVHCHGYTGGTVGRIAAIFAKTPIIIFHTHNTHEDHLKRQNAIEGILNRFTDKILYCSWAALRSARRIYHVDDRKALVVYNGVDKERFTEKIDIDVVKKEFHIPLEVKVIGSIASLTYRKGHRYLIDAMKRIKDSVPPDQMPKLMLVGDGEARKDLEAQAERLGLSSDVVFVGAQTKINKFLSIMDIFALTSHLREGLGICLIEAMAKGIPTIGTKVGGIMEVINDGETGILVPPKDSRGLAEAIILLLRDKDMAKSMGLAAITLYEEKFTHQHMMEIIEGVYYDLIEKKIGRCERFEKISAALIVMNEEKHIGQCLESLYWADEIVILDGYSTDGTIDIAKKYTDKIYQKAFEGFPREREYLLTKTGNNWVFMVDADMVILPDLIKEIEENFSRSVQEYSAFTFRFLNIYLGREIRHCGWYDPNNPRLFDKKKGKYDTRMKYIDSFIPEGKVKVMKKDILHYGFETINEHFARINRYTDLNAEDLREKGIKIRAANIPNYFILKPFTIFCYKYIVKKGFLDGVVGLILCLMAAITYSVSYYKLWELQRVKRDQI